LWPRQAAIEPVIGHLKEHHRMGRNYLAHASGAINAVLAAAGYNFRRLLAWLRFLLLRILIALGLAAPKTEFFTDDLESDLVASGFVAGNALACCCR
jgi:transposase, IS5 family